jgi:DNA-binding CsgD family transcriptional regulator
VGKLLSQRLSGQKWLVLFTLVFLYGNDVVTQTSIGQNEIKIFARTQYGAGTQNWAIVQDNKNRLYFANNEGLLVFNGTNWQVYPVPNKTILRSIAFGPGGKLFAGAQDELGYYAPDQAGRLQFTSLKNLLPVNEKNFTDVWELECTEKDVFFRTNAKIYKLTGDKFEIYPATSAWLSLHKYQQRILAHDKKDGLLVYENARWSSLITAEMLPPGFFVTDIITYKKDTSLVSTTSNGLYLLTQNKLIPFPVKSFFFNPLQHFTSLAVINDSGFLAGTYFNGVYRISENGEVLENISTKNGLPNNTVRYLFAANNNDAWICLDNGIAFYPGNNAIKHINPATFNNGAGYGVKSFNGELYFALSTGLQWLPVSSPADLSTITDEPKKILDGLTWNLSVVNNQLFSGRDDGLWKINNHKASPVSAGNGYWLCQPIPSTSPLQIAAGNYSGIHLFDVAGNSFTDKGIVKNFTESSRYLETDDNNIWVSHPYRGVYKISLKNYSVSLYNQSKGLPADLDNHVFKIKGKVLFATVKGIYEYNPSRDEIIPAKEFASLFGEKAVRYLKEDEKGNIWFVQDKMLGVADYSSGNPVVHYIPELTNRILSGFENIFPYNTKNVFAGAENGFFLINYEAYRNSLQPLKVYLTSVKTIGNRDSIFFGGFTNNNTEDVKEIAVKYRMNSLHFACAATLFSQNTNTEFSYFLDGFDNSWSEWDTNNEKDYTNLPAGTYSLKIKARNSPSHESPVYAYRFTIIPPWYQTWWTYSLYIIVLAALFYTLFKYQDKKHRQKQEARILADKIKYEEEQRRLAYQHQLELEKTENELIRLRNEKLETEIEHKNSELASIALNLVQKKEFQLKITEELNKLHKADNKNIEPSEIKKILRTISSDEKLAEDWEQFSVHFNNVHSDFLINLKNKYPVLNAYDLKLCAYLRMNLSSKEMAKLMSISVRGVEIGRYRLRKKLQLQPKEDLFQFLLTL